MRWNQRGFSVVEGLLIVIVISFLVGAGGVVYYRRQQQTTTNANKPGESGVDRSSEIKSLPKAHNQFGFNMLRELTAGNKDNVFISPSSISLALSMVYNGASSTTKDAMQKALQFDELGLNTVNKESQALIDTSKNPEQKIQLSIANSAWIRQGTEIKSDFLSVIDIYYKAKATQLDFKSPQAAPTINDWVKKSTNNKIEKIVDEIPDDMVMYLINAVYFKGSWHTEFDKNNTSSRPFTLSDGSKVNRELMSLDGDLPYFETDEVESVKLDYGDKKHLSMYVFLPDNLDSFIGSLNDAKWRDMLTKYSEQNGHLVLPKFKLDYEQNLRKSLGSLGMGIAFTDKADFSGISKGVLISEVKHKTFIDVNEEGTEAAAVTDVGVGITSIGPSGFSMVVDRPFLFAIQDNRTSEILFIGRIENPKAD